MLHHVTPLGDVVSVDDIYAAIVLLLADSEVAFCSGVIHGRNMTAQTPAFVQEAAVLHALRALREWTAQADQATLHHIAIRAGDAPVCRHLEQWFQTRRWFL